MWVATWTLIAGIFSGFVVRASEQDGLDRALPATAAERLRQDLETTTGALRQHGEAALADLLEQFYADREYRPAWAQRNALTAARDLLVRIAASHEDGLCPMRYGVPQLRDRVAVTRVPGRGDQTLRPDLSVDVDLSTALLRYVVHLGLGHPATDDLTASARDLDVLSAFQGLRHPDTLHASLRTVQPQHAEYRQLRGALARLRSIVLRGGWPSVPEIFLRPGDSAEYEVLQVLVERLRSSGDLTDEWPGDGDGAVYGSSVVEGVRRFQTRHGLAVDGIVGPRTIAALNVPASARLEQIEINMDRWRRVPDRLGATHVRVNIPEFRLRLFDNGEPRLRMRTIVGKADTQTPVFSDRIRYMVFNPYWNVPDSIVSNEIAPKAADDTSHLDEAGFEVLSGWEEDAEAIDPAAVDWEAERRGYRIRQLPGPENALGRVKFMFPNRYSVYLHDTPGRALFDQPDRALSHGCVRVAEPQSLAEALLTQSSESPAAHVDEAMRGDERQVIQLPDPVPVHLLYLTAWVDHDGAVQFREDVYERDREAHAWLGCRRDASE